ncbi:unnamed protein product [Rotaria sp. Silwood1]|nr:unnamed protein product [Rotaria sp. Silwood1]
METELFYVPERFFDAHQELLQKLPSIEDYGKKPLVTLEKALEPLRPLIDNFEILPWTAKSIMRQPTYDLNYDEAGAIYLYTIWRSKEDQTIPSQLNKALRSGERNRLNAWSSYLHLLVVALNKLPPMRGTIWRYGRGDVTNNYQKDCIWLGFSSCVGPMSNVTNQGKDSVYTVFEIKCINGKAICNYSEFPQDDEVILMPGTRLRVMRKEDLTTRLKKIYLQEDENQLLAKPSAWSLPIDITYRTEQDFKMTIMQPNGEIKSLQSSSKCFGIEQDVLDNIFDY